MRTCKTSWIIGTFALAIAGLLGAGRTAAADPWVVYDGDDGPGKGKHVVLVSGDEEYRSEEALPQLGKILAKHHGFKCTVLFAIDPADGTIDPVNHQQHPRPGGPPDGRPDDHRHAVPRSARRADEAHRRVPRGGQAGHRPAHGHPRLQHRRPARRTPKYSCNSKEQGWDGGFGRQVLGETWINHHGHHGARAPAASIGQGQEQNPIVRGCEDIWGPTDVYTVRLPLPGDSKPLVLGQVLDGHEADRQAGRGQEERPDDAGRLDQDLQGRATGQTGRVFTTTMGAANDLASEGLRRLLVNAAYWCVGLEDKIPARANVDIVGEYKPTYFGFGKHVKGVKPADYAIK